MKTQPEINQKTEKGKIVKCDVCQRVLTRKKSIERGRGPVCAAKQLEKRAGE